MDHFGNFQAHLMVSDYEFDQSIGVSALTSILPMNTQDWSPLGWTGWISLQSKGLTLSTLSSFFPSSAPIISPTFWPRSSGENKRRNAWCSLSRSPIVVCQCWVTLTEAAYIWMDLLGSWDLCLPCSPGPIIVMLPAITSPGGTLSSY